MKYFLNLVLVLSFFIVKSQSYIEVIVTDSVMVKADYFVYGFYADKNVSLVDDVDPLTSVEKSRRKTRSTVDSLKTVLIAKGFRFLPSSIRDSVFIAEYSTKVHKLVTYSVDSLAQAYVIIAAAKNVNAYLFEATSKNQSTALKKLYIKILAFAHQQAEMIAAASGSKPGNVLSITEKPAEYPSLSTIGATVAGWHTSVGPELVGDWFPLTKTFTVRYSLK